MRRIICAFIVDALIVFLSVMAIYGNVEIPKDGWGIAVTYAENGDDIVGDGCQLFYTEKRGEFSQENSSVQNISEEFTATFALPMTDMKNISFRLDPMSSAKTFSIQKLDVLLYGTSILSIEGTELSAYIDHLDNCEYISGETSGTFASTTDDPAIYLNEEINKAARASATELFRKVEVPEEFVLLVVLGAFVQLKTILSVFEKKDKRKSRAKQRETIALIAAQILLCIGIAIIYAWRYLSTNFAGVEMSEIVYHLNTSLDGSNVATFLLVIMRGIELILVALVAVAVVVHFLRSAKKNRVKIFARCLAGVGIVMMVFGTYQAFTQLKLVDYIKYSMEKTTIYEEYYADAQEVALTFPEKKRNLIYIYLESMETTYADVANGGAMEDNLIPELIELSKENINFSTGGVNGGHTLSGTTFTTGAMVAQTSGMPINTSIMGTNYNQDGEHYLLPGAWTLGDVLKEEGYNQVLMVGSDGNFGGRSLYFKGHGDYEIYDHDKVKSIGWLPTDYMIWWGYEDQKLIDFAKVEISYLAQQDEPFNFTMLTADTHFTAGYRCELCDTKYQDATEYQYGDVLACSSKQIAGFVEWIKEQDFYENTTIIVSGDHLTMDSEYMEKFMIDPDYHRKTYFTIINPAEDCEEDDREFSTLDIYPTTLAAMGVTIEGDRLGMGVNLFSDTPTLYEEYGEEYLNAEFLKNSDLYSTLIY